MNNDKVLFGLLLFSAVNIFPFLGGDVEDDPENIKMAREARQEAQEECNECMRGTWSKVCEMFRGAERTSWVQNFKESKRDSSKKMR